MSRLVVLDGPSSVGKSTIAARLSEIPDLRLELVKRYTTRHPRPGDAVEQNYVFVTPGRFERLEREGRFIEVRHFRFGMSYGLPFSAVDSVLRRGKNPLAIISLGNAALVKAHYPRAFAVFVDAPHEAIRLRLESRGIPQEMVEERLANAATSDQFRQSYDAVIINEQGHLEEVLTETAQLLRTELADGRVAQSG